MVLPIPAVSAGGFLAESLIYKMTITFTCLLLLELGLSAARFYILDIWGGVIMTLISVFGFFLVKYRFDIQWTLMFGITIFFYGLIHFVMLLEKAILNWGNFPETSNGPKPIVRDSLFIIAPILDWTLSGLCFYIFKSATSHLHSASAAERQPLTGSIASSTFTPFSGQGRKLA